MKGDKPIELRVTSDGSPTLFCSEIDECYHSVHGARTESEYIFLKHGFDPEKKLVSVFPGSRVFELKQLMNVFTKSAKALQKAHPDLQFCISHAPNLDNKILCLFFYISLKIVF